jgi:hypothetical protein
MAWLLSALAMPFFLGRRNGVVVERFGDAFLARDARRPQFGDDRG